MVEQEAKEKYLKIIKQLERPYEEKQDDDRIYDWFKTRVSKQFRLEVTCDSALQVALYQHYKECQKIFLSTQSFGKKLKFIQKLNSIFRQFQFISRRQYTKLKEIIEKELNNPANKLLQNIVYLKSSADLFQFRYQFLGRYSGLNEDDSTEITQRSSQDEGLKILKRYYENFFTKCLQEGVNPKIINFVQNIFCQFENKSQMLSPKLIKQLQSRLGISEIGMDEKEIQINQKLRNLAEENAYNNDQQISQRLEDQIKVLEKAFKKFSGLNIFKQKKLMLTLGKFGSLTSGFAGVDADLDLTILTNCYINQLQLLRLLYQFLRKQYKGEDNRGSRRINLDFIQNAKTPLLQVLINERGKQTVKIDIIVNNILGIINSKFLSVYASVKWIKNLGILIKMWGKNENLIGKNYLSSYAMILMFIHYLIKTKKAKPILDNRLKTSQKPFFQYKRLKQTEIERFKVYYVFKKEAKDVSAQERANYYNILLGFTHYYAYELWEEADQKKRIITVDQCIQKQVDKETVITIKDPFDQPHNPGRMKIDAKDFFIQKFKDANLILKSGDPSKIEQLFARK